MLFYIMLISQNKQIVHELEHRIQVLINLPGIRTIHCKLAVFVNQINDN